jgi:hypothetical protein
LTEKAERLKLGWDFEKLTEPTDPEEGEHLFHSQMWVKGTPLHFIVDSGS